MLTSQMIRRPSSTRSAPLAILIVLALACALAASSALAAGGVIQGKVLNEKGEPFGFVDVAVEPEEGYTYTESALTEEDGSFRFPAVPVGNYKLTAFADGYQVKEAFGRIGVTQGSAQTFTITLIPIAAQQETIVVNSSVLDLLDIKKTDTSSTISGDFVSKIPLQNKRIQDIVFLFPGVTRSGSSDSTDISIGGGTSGQVGYRLNGMSINDPVNGGPVLDMPTAAIESFKLITGGFNAEYGEQSSGIADIVTKGGRNEVDFSFGLDFRDTDYGAQGIEGLDEAAKNVDEIVRAEGTLLEAELAAGFRLLGVDPISTLEDDHNPTPRHRVRQTISAGGPIVRDKVFFHTTIESLADDYGNAYADGWNQNDQITFVSKVNWNVYQGEGTSNTLEFTVNADSSDDAGFAGLLSTRSTNTLFSNSAWTAGISDIHVFNDTTVLDSKLNFTHTTVAVRPEDVRTGVGTRYNIFMPPGGFVSYAVGAANTSFDETIDAIRGETALTKSFDKHNFKGGVSYQYQTFKSFQDDGDTVNDLRVINDRSVFSVQQQVGTLTRSGAANRTDDASWQAAIFAQDNWSVTDNLTIDIGFRGDYQSFVGELFLAPRVGFSLDPIGDGKTRFYGNWGLFYDNIFANALEFAQTPDTFRGDLFFTQQFIAAGGARFSSIGIDEIYKEALATPIDSPDPEAVAFIRPTFQDRYRLDDDISAPRNNSWSLGIERRLPGNTRVQLGYSHIERSHQLRTRTETVRVAVNPGDYTVRDQIYESTGEGKYDQYAFEFQRPFSEKWEMNFSYTHSKNVGPIAPPENPVDPNDVFFVDGNLGNDRTHVAKLQSHAIVGKKAKLDISGDFTWQTGTPVSARIVLPDGTTLYPGGRNSYRLPSSRQLNFGMQRVWHTKTDKPLSITGRLQFYNLLNDLNVFGGIVTFETPEGSADPQSFPPLRSEIIITDVDVSRSMEVGITVGF